MFSVVYAELCFQAGGKSAAEKNIEKWVQDANILKATAEAAARAKARVPGAVQHDDVAWADADRRALANLQRAE